MVNTFAIRTENLGRIYKIRSSKKSEHRELIARQDVNLSIQQGELFGLLGSNGGGKTTLIKPTGIKIEIDYVEQTRDKTIKPSTLQQ